MKTYLPFLLLLTILFSSCQSHYGKRFYKKLKKESIENSQIRTLGYYYYQDSTYHKYNYKRKIYNGAFSPEDSIKIVYYNFIVLDNKGTGYVNLTTRWDGLHHSVYDASTLAKGTNSKDSAHAQFLNWAKPNKVFDNKTKKSSFPALYKIKNDSIFIYYFQYVIDGKSTLYELKGTILDNNSFEIANKKRYKTIMFGKEKNYKTSMIFKFEELK